jgi:hypothetical protein
MQKWCMPADGTDTNERLSTYLAPGGAWNGLNIDHIAKEGNEWCCYYQP